MSENIKLGRTSETTEFVSGSVWWFIRFNDSSHQTTSGGVIAASVSGGFVVVCVCVFATLRVSNSVCNMLPLTKLFWGQKRANVAADTGNSPEQQPLDSVGDARLVLRVALEIMHNKNECWSLAIRGHFLIQSRWGVNGKHCLCHLRECSCTQIFGRHLDEMKVQFL